MELPKKITNKRITLVVLDVLIINLAYFLALYFRFDLNFTQIPIFYLDAFKKIRTNKYSHKYFDIHSTKTIQHGIRICII